MNAKCTVLIVDDDPNFRKSLSGIFRVKGYAPIAAATGKVALERIEEESPAVALIDLRLEDIPGLEVMRGIKERCPGTECIVLTGHATQKSAIEAVNLGAYSYVQKPCDMEQLLVTVRRAIEKREAAEALWESEERYRSFVQNFHGIAFRGDINLVPMFFHGAVEAITGYTEDEFIAGVLRWDQVILPDDFLKIHESVEKIRSNPGYSTEREYRILRKDGQIWWVHEDIQNICDDSGKPVMVQGAIYDITGRKQAEEEIRQRTAQLEALRQMGLELTAQLDLDALLRSIVSRAIELLGGISGGIDLYRPDRDVLEWTAAIGPDMAPPGGVIYRGEGISGRVWETGEPVIVDDYQHWEGRAASWQGIPAAAIVGVPVRWGGEFLGSLVVHGAPPHVFSPADAELLGLFATQAATAIRNARLYEQAQARSRYLETLQKINATLRSTLPLSRVLETIAQGAGEALNYVASFIVVPDATGKRLVMGAAWGSRFLDKAIKFTGVEVTSFKLPLTADENLIIQAYLSGELQAWGGEPEQIVVQIEPAISPKQARAFRRTMGAKLAVCVPLSFGNRVAGVLVVLSPRAQLLDEERAMLLGLADQAGLAIENARLFDETQRFAQRTQSLYETSRALSSSLEEESLLHTILEAAYRNLSCEHVVISIVDEEAGTVGIRHGIWRGELDVFPEWIQMSQYSLDQPDILTDIYRTGRTEIIQEWDERFNREIWDKFDHGRFLRIFMPIKMRDRVIGIVEAGYDKHEKDHIDEEEVQMLAAFMDHAAVVLENARLYEEARQRALEQETVSRIACALNTLDARDAFPVLVDGLYELTGCDVASLAVMDETGEQFVVADLDSPFPLPVRPNLGGRPFVPLRVGGAGGGGDVVPLSDTAALESLEVGRPHLTADLSTETDFPFEQALYQIGLRSQVALPLLSGGELFGALILSGSHTGLFREDQLPVLQQIADAVALSIENSFLFHAEREQRELAEALEVAAAAVSSTLEPDQVLDRILEQVERVVAGDAFNVMLIDDGAAHVVRSRGYEYLGIEEQIARFSTPVFELPSLVHMVQTKEPVIISDTSTDPEWVLLEGWEWLHSYVGALIRVGEGTVGALNVDGTRPGQFGPADAHRLEAFANHAAAAIENARLFEQAQQEIAERKRAEEKLQQSLERLRRTFEGTVEALVSTIGIRDPYTASHQRRVTQLACAIADEMDLSEEQIQGLRMAGLVHDLGKMNIPADILSKPGPLSDFEYTMTRMHVQAGYDVLKEFDFPWPVAQIVLQHHERMDGSGYPQGLSGEEIILEARILAVADVVTAMVSHRPYRPACGMDKTLKEIAQNRGILYDAEVVDVCLKLFAEKRFEFE